MVGNRALISQSVDAEYYRYKIKFEIKCFFINVITVSIFIMCVHIFVFLNEWRNSPWEMVVMIVKIILVYYLIAGFILMIRVLSPVDKLMRLFKDSDIYMFSTAVLSEYHTLGEWFYFAVVIEDRKGQQLDGCTAHIYRAGAMKADFVEWHNKEVLAAYNPCTKKVIVIGPAEKFSEFASGDGKMT